jgi:pheromone a factor receptor
MVNNVNDPGAPDPITSSDGVYINAILLPLFAFPAWILCCIPMGWHFSQHNIAAGSLLLWVVLVNFFNSINPLIWPDDNLEQWWHGHGWCDISIRVQVGAGVAIASCAAMIVRKLAMVMDTSKMTVSSSRSPGIKEKLIEIIWCWGWPMVLIAMHAIVSGVRYMIFGIVGCISEYHASWPSLALGYIWTPITTLGAAYYASKSLQRIFPCRR